MNGRSRGHPPNVQSSTSSATSFAVGALSGKIQLPPWGRSEVAGWVLGDNLCHHSGQGLMFLLLSSTAGPCRSFCLHSYCVPCGRPPSVYCYRPTLCFSDLVHSDSHSCRGINSTTGPGRHPPADTRFIQSLRTKRFFAATTHLVLLPCQRASPITGQRLRY